ncbi:MAG TPA: hypothetical protein VM450_17025 [Thermomicrobiales bacterium]|nr:hypothetical protein [Thermomicrobiales bacterium]
MRRAVPLLTVVVVLLVVFSLLIVAQASSAQDNPDTMANHPLVGTWLVADGPLFFTTTPGTLYAIGNDTGVATPAP